MESVQQVFASELCFIEHCRRHIVNKNDVWIDLIDPQLVILSRIVLEKSTRDMIDSVKNGPLADLYAKTFNTIITNVMKSVKMPLYSVSYSGSFIFWLTTDGMVTISRGGVIRTAFFPGTKLDSKHIKFQKAWLYAVRNVVQTRSMHQERMMMISESNWSKPPGFAADVDGHHGLLDAKPGWKRKDEGFAGT